MVFDDGSRILPSGNVDDGTDTLVTERDKWDEVDKRIAAYRKGAGREKIDTPIYTAWLVMDNLMLVKAEHWDEFEGQFAAAKIMADPHTTVEQFMAFTNEEAEELAYDYLLRPVLVKELAEQHKDRI